MSDLYDWFQTPPGQCVLAWEQACCASTLADVFGYHALQLGLPALSALASNRIQHHWLALESPAACSLDTSASDRAVALVCDAAALPLAEASLDLVVLPHTLEFSADPHGVLREVQRVLVHDGKLAIIGFNPVSLWGFKQLRVELMQYVGGSGRRYLPEVHGLMGRKRLLDWLRLLQFEVEHVQFGCWQPAMRSAAGLNRMAWMDRLGARWWPVMGAVYMVLASKRTLGAKLMASTWKSVPVPRAAPVSVANHAPSASTDT